MNLRDVGKGSTHGPGMCFTSDVSCELMEKNLMLPEKKKKKSLQSRTESSSSQG